jgi:hypothetical protein
MSDMSENPTAGSPRRYRWVRRVGLPAGVVFLVAAAGWLGMKSVSSGRHTPSDWDTKLIDVPPCVASKPVPAASAGLTPDAVVIGVSFAGVHRAYPVAVMSDSISHVINDRIAGRPLTVAYCDRTSCVRAFTARDGQPAINLAVGGWLNEGGVSDMLLRNGPHRYRLKTGEGLNPDAPPFPFEGVQAELTSWREWRAAHPDTELVRTFSPVNLVNH